MCRHPRFDTAGGYRCIPSGAGDWRPIEFYQRFTGLRLRAGCDTHQ
jgi:hypothetical protein